MRKVLLSLYGYELKKILSSRIALGAFIIIIFVGAFIFWRDGVYYRDGENSDILSAEHALDGRPVDDILLSELAEKVSEGRRLPSNQEGAVDFRPEDAAYQNLFSWIYNMIFLWNMELDDPASSLTSERLYGQLDKRRQEIMTSQQLSAEEISFWEKKAADVEKPLVWSYKAGPSGMLSSYMATILSAMMILGICLAETFAGETTRRTDALILCTANGRRSLFAAKVLAGHTAAFILSLALLSAVHVPRLVLFGTTGMNSPVQIAKPYMAFPWSLGYTIVVYTVEYLFSTLLACAFTLFLSVVVKNGVAVAGITCMTALISTALSVPDKYRFLSQLVDLCPVWLLVNGNRPDFRLVHIFGRYFTNLEIAPVLYTALSLLLLAAAGSVWRRRQADGR